MAERDSQRKKLYTAERVALEPLAIPLLTTDDVKAYLVKQLSRATLQRRYGNVVDLKEWGLTVADGRGTRRALAYGTYKISLPLWARTDWVALHEVAHVIHDRLSSTRARRGDRNWELRGGAAHGWQYAAIYLDLVRYIKGKEAGDALKAAFKAHKVRFRPKQKRAVSVTPEVLAARLEKARTAKVAKKIQNEVVNVYG